MIIDILHSTIDPAGCNIRRAMDLLIAEHGKEAFPLFEGNEVTFHTTDDRIINADTSVLNPEADIIIIVSRHSSVNPVPVLTVHPPGNFRDAQLGGGDFELGKTSPAWMKAILQNHAKFVPEGYRVSYEITHHGPTNFPAPTLFVEVGSTETEWHDEAAYTAAAKSVLYARPAGDVIPIIGFGGTHYAVRQTVIGQTTRGALGHMMHTRDVGSVKPDMVSQMIEKSCGAVAAHVDRKALSKLDIAHIEGILAALSIPEITEGDLMKLNHMSYETWEKYVSAAGEIEKGLKIFPHGDISAGDPAQVSLPADLFSHAFGRDDAPLLSYLDEIGGICHLTGAGGKLLPTFLTDTQRVKDVSIGLIGLAVQQITRTQDSVVDGDILTITKRQFDAKLARMLGVPSGPLFGKLSKGEAVTLPDGRTITADEVMMVTQISINIPGLEN